MKNIKKRNIIFCLILILPLIWFLSSARADALAEDKIIEIISTNKKLFQSNSLADSVLRTIGWGIVFGLAELAAVCTKLYDTCFGFVDFTTYKPVAKFIDKWEPVFIALVCLSLLFLGLILMFWHEKKPKFIMNLCIAVLVVSSSGYLIDQMNGFIGTEVRKEILGGSTTDVLIYGTLGNNIHDLLYLDEKAGLANLNEKTEDENAAGKTNATLTYEELTQTQFYMIEINEVVKPDMVKKESKDIIETKLVSEIKEGIFKMAITSLYSGVAWTDLLNNYYYRYTIDWGSAILELVSMIIIYIFLSYKVVKTLFEIVVHRVLAYLYSANLAGNQKILKILDGIKDSYITLILTTVILKIYHLAMKFISGWEVSGLTKGIILIFIAFAVVDGPNILQKLTGMDAGAGDGMSKVLSAAYSTQMGISMLSMAAGGIDSAGQKLFSNRTTKDLQSGVPKNTPPDPEQNSGSGENSTASVPPDNSGDSNNEQNYSAENNQNEPAAEENNLQQNTASQTDENAAQKDMSVNRQNAFREREGDSNASVKNENSDNPMAGNMDNQFSADSYGNDSMVGAEGNSRADILNGVSGNGQSQNAGVLESMEREIGKDRMQAGSFDEAARMESPVVRLGESVLNRNAGDWERNSLGNMAEKPQGAVHDTIDKISESKETMLNGKPLSIQEEKGGITTGKGDAEKAARIKETIRRQNLEEK